MKVLNKFIFILLLIAIVPIPTKSQGLVGVGFGISYSNINKPAANASFLLSNVYLNFGYAVNAYDLTGNRNLSDLFVGM